MSRPVALEGGFDAQEKHPVTVTAGANVLHYVMQNGEEGTILKGSSKRFTQPVARVWAPALVGSPFGNSYMAEFK